MINQKNDPKYQFWCWAIATLGGVLIYLMLLFVAGKSFIAALVLGVIAFILPEFLFNWLFYVSLWAAGEGASSLHTAGTAVGAGAVAVVAASGSSSKPGHTGSAASAAAASTKSGPDADAKATANKAAADDFKLITKIGPKLEGVCNGMGVYHFDQIAVWATDEMAWVNTNLQGLKGCAMRDDWVGQVKLLAAGGEKSSLSA